jgi:hypothetical protein
MLHAQHWILTILLLGALPPCRHTPSLKPQSVELSLLPKRCLSPRHSPKQGQFMPVTPGTGPCSVPENVTRTSSCLLMSAPPHRRTASSLSLPRTRPIKLPATHLVAELQAQPIIILRCVIVARYSYHWPEEREQGGRSLT